MNFLLSFIFDSPRITKIILSICAVLLTSSSILLFTKTKELENLMEKNTELILTNSTLQTNNQSLKQNQETLLKVNDTNRETIQRLDDERKESKKAIESLAAMNKRDRHALDKIGNKIDEMIKDPANDGDVAPVLREAIRDIQIQRNEK